MNSLPDNIKNYLFIPELKDYSSNLYKLCLEKLKQGHLILCITSRHFNFYKLHKELQITPAQLKRLIIMQLPSLHDITQKLLTLHNWPLIPTFVVLDLYDYILNMDTNSIMEQLPYCLASLFNYTQCLHLRHSQNVPQQNFTQPIYSLVLISKADDEAPLRQNHIEILKNLFYYETDLYHNFKDISLRIKGVYK